MRKYSMKNNNNRLFKLSQKLQKCIILFNEKTEFMLYQDDFNTVVIINIPMLNENAN